MSSLTVALPDCARDVAEAAAAALRRAVTGQEVVSPRCHCQRMCAICVTFVSGHIPWGSPCLCSQGEQKRQHKC